MGQFKPMVKMFTDEPSVILKLKKGGKVKAAGQAEGFKSMSETSKMHGAHEAFESEHGSAPKKPSMADRRKAMNPNQYAKGGKVAKKALGGAMGAPMGAPAAMPAAGAGMGAAAGAMTPAQRLARIAAIKRAMTGMKKGGSADHKELKKLEKELHKHEKMSCGMAHKASGGKIDKAETKTTLKNSVAKFAKTKVVDGDKCDYAHGTKGIKEGKPAGYKMGGTIEGNEKKFENTKMVKAGVDHAHGTGGVRMANAGGFKKGGKIAKKASGGSIDKKLTRTTVEGGNWENRAANTAKPGVKGTKTGAVKEANAGGYKKGGSAKKAYATGGNVVDDGKAVKYPKHFVSRPVANSLQSGTFKKGGKVVRKAEGGSLDAQDLKNQKGYENWEKIQAQDNRDDATLIPRTITRGINAVKNAFGFGNSAPAGSVTKTKESVTVAPKRKGGSAKKY